jgi:hypothetical protein
MKCAGCGIDVDTTPSLCDTCRLERQRHNRAKWHARRALLRRRMGGVA